MKNLLLKISILAILIMFFGCVKENRTLPMNTYFYNVTSKGIINSITYLSPGGVYISGTNGIVKYPYEYTGTKYMYITATLRTQYKTDTVTVQIYRNDILIAENTSNSKATVSGTY